MRGKPKCRALSDVTARITPADAGKTDGKRNRGCGKKDHPRGCGENTVPKVGFGMSRGSPPRMRGKPKCRALSDVTARITPADAGKTDGKRNRGCGKKDHPRGCGENEYHLLQAAFKRGSPPRMRGKPRRWCCEMFEYRITPADAGKTGKKDG